MDVVIKSFFRPYYLDRCLRSIKLNISGSFTVTILDDGTPQVYLKRIQENYPQVKILKSKAYKQKTQLIDLHLKGEKTYDNKSIPVELWKEFISDCSGNFLLLEEDAWVTEKIDIESFDQLMMEENLLIVKLGWNNNPQVVRGKKVAMTGEVEEVKPDLPIKSPTILKPYLGNSFKIRSILNKLKITSLKGLLPYYTLYTVSSAFFNKQYWLYLWEGTQSTVNEPKQLLKALKWHKKGTNHKYGKTVDEFVKTSFLTASTNRLSSSSFDMVRLNHILSKTWLDGGLDAMENYPCDFSQSYFEQIVNMENDPLCTVPEWKEWINLFKGIHKRAGSNID